MKNRTTDMKPREFEACYRRLYMPLCMYALRLTEDIDMAADIVQTSFMNVWNRLQDGHEIRSLEIYLYRAVRNTAIAQLRRDNVYTPMPDEMEVVAEEDIDTAERDARLWMAIDSMPARRGEIFLMSKRDGMTYAEIAGTLNISVKTVEHQISKALAAMRTHSRSLPFLLMFL